ncbi:MAG: RagB/SusD family nutrient uptake outer membrane protein [Pedobacter sp.]|uniref:RagB/SusD family nutrient uptake outer membrane protein n=1 Tax=Pedobacter sp. TaxID=1411316 RepID=UPI0028094964|nr:RagB/SusD family nutrient uptake outer membrane protein [Pedobacter sp.]MDQ8005151.1 RagB/SusD family nutrient uptake outer membrane protein [Pedobacter sp.]
MNKLKIYFSIAVLGAMSFTGCKEAIETTARQSIDIETALNSKENVNAAIISVYAKLKSARVYGRDLIAFPEALADNGRFTNRSGRFANEARNIPLAHFADWQNLYYGINEANLILDAIPSLNVTPAVTTAERNAWEGQVQFLRALFYFELVRQYAYDPGAVVPSQDRGGVPIITKGVKTLQDAVLTLPTRAPIADVYALIYKDLKDAEAKLGNIGLSPALATKQAAQGLLARAALYNKDYATAKTYADLVIASQGSKLLTPSQYVNGWRNKVNPESLFEVTFTINAENIGVNESLQTSFTTLVVAGNRAQTGGFGDLVPTNTLLADLGITVSANGGAAAAITARNSDVRNLLFELGTAGRGAPFVECTKYLGKNGFINLDNAVVLRVAEMFLVRAEAQSTTGSPVFDEAAARTDLIRIKQNRYTDYATSAQAITDAALTGTSLQNEILKQRRIEFAFEGHRFFDLKRLGKNITKTPHYTDLLFTDYRILPNIPAREVDGNPDRLKQNFGY